MPLSPVLGDGSQPCGATLAPVSEGTWGISAGMGGGGGCFPPEHLLRWYRRLLHPGAAMLRAHICQMPFLSPGVTQALCPPVLGGPHTSPLPPHLLPRALETFSILFSPSPTPGSVFSVGVLGGVIGLFYLSGLGAVSPRWHPWVLL